jgi:hypothetical protein
MIDEFTPSVTRHRAVVRCEYDSVPLCVVGRGDLIACGIGHLLDF